MKHNKRGNNLINNTNDAELSEVKEIMMCHCGKIINKNWNYCPNCQVPIKKDKGNLYLIIFVCSIIISAILKFYYGFLISILIMIAAKIRYPNNKIISTVFSVIIGLIAILVFTALLLQYMCATLTDGCLG